MTPEQKLEMEKKLTTAHSDHEKGLNARAFFKLNDHTRGEDLVQDTFIKTWKYLVKGGEIHLMKAFLYHILNHLIVDEYRKKKTQSLDTLLESGFEPSDTYSQFLLNRLDGKDALLLIQKLPQMDHETMKMRYIRDLSLKEIALITGKSRNAVAVQIHRGLKKLKLILEEKNILLE